MLLLKANRGLLRLTLRLNLTYENDVFLTGFYSKFVGIFKIIFFSILIKMVFDLFSVIFLLI